jgi:hypothetical protein
MIGDDWRGFTTTIMWIPKDGNNTSIRDEAKGRA